MDNNINEGAFEVWKDENISSLESDFIKDNSEHFEEYCKIIYGEFKDE